MSANKKKYHEIIIIECVAEGVFKATFHAGKTSITIEQGNKLEVQRAITEFTNKYSKTYAFSICNEWDEE